MTTSGLTHVGAVGKRAKKKAVDPAPAIPVPQRTRPHRTLQNCFQETEDTLYNVNKITATRWNKGSLIDTIFIHSTLELKLSIRATRLTVIRGRQWRTSSAAHRRFVATSSRDSRMTRPPPNKRCRDGRRPKTAKSTVRALHKSSQICVQTNRKSSLAPRHMFKNISERQRMSTENEPLSVTVTLVTLVSHS